MDKNAVRGIFRASGNDEISLLQQAEFTHENLAVFIYGHAVHAALLCQSPRAIELEILRKNAHGVVALGCNAVLGRRKRARLGRVNKSLF